MNHGDIYRALAVRYGWGPDVVASMTPAQHVMYLIDGEKDGQDYIEFATLKEFRQWKQRGR